METLGADDPRVIGEYRLRARLGSDGMGQVYLGPPGQVAYPATQTYPGQQGYLAPPAGAIPQGYPPPQAGVGPPSYPGPQGYPGQQVYPGPQGGAGPAAPRGYLPGGAGYQQPAQPAWAPAARPAWPASVRTAVRFMYVGAGIALLSGLRDLGTVIGGDDYVEQRVFGSAQLVSRSTALAYVTIGFVVQVALWIGLARACKRGKNWARIAGSVFFGFLTLGLVTGLNSSGDAGVILEIADWLVGLVAVILLWRRASSDFFETKGR